MMLGRRLRTSCSAGQSAGLDWFALDSIQTRVCIYDINYGKEGRGFAGRIALWRCCNGRSCVLSEFSSRSLELGFFFEVNYYVVYNQ